jgi:hypothetical protein
MATMNLHNPILRSEGILKPLRCVTLKVSERPFSGESESARSDALTVTLFFDGQDGLNEAIDALVQARTAMNLRDLDAGRWDEAIYGPGV